MLATDIPAVPYLKYPGGKRKLVPQIAQHYEPYRDRRFVDLFCGSAAVSLGLRPAAALLNDACAPVINLHKWVQCGWGKALETQGYWVRFENDEQVYYENRDRFNELLSSGLGWTLEAALLLYYLNRTGFNGLLRFSQEGRYADWEITCQDFASVPLCPTDFVYADPPYDSVEDDSVEQLSLLGIEHQGQAGDGFVGYSGAFGWGEQVRLARHLAQHPGPVLVSNAATRRVVQLYGDLGFSVEEVLVRRSISRTGDRPMAREIFAFKAEQNA